jgi:hypothetical protein
MTNSWVFPPLPKDFRWVADMHRNAFAGEVVSIKIIKRKLVNILGIRFAYNKEVGRSVTYDEPGWVQDEIDRLTKMVNG